ncbi:MAG: 50S ribosomal protein L23 [Candidatus Kerfeldbacteria bacterium]
MGLFDRFKSKKESIGKDKKPKHVLLRSSKQRADEEKRRQFAAVPAAGVAHKPAESKEQPSRHKEDKKPAEQKTAQKRKGATGNAYRILHHTHVSEKATAASAQNQYTFVVAADANKVEVKQAIQALYGVRPFKVNILNYRGKNIRYGRTQGRTKDWKKAIVTLLPGQRIDTTGA